jgi:hypothetical protein
MGEVRMKITLSDLRHTNPEHTNIELTVALDLGQPFPFDGTPIPFHYVPGDDAPFTLAIKNELAKGVYSIAPYVARDHDVVISSGKMPASLLGKGKSSVIAN